MLADRRLLGQRLCDPLESDLAPLPQAHDPGKGNGRPHQHRQVSVKGDQLSEGHLACRDLPAADGDGEHHTDAAGQGGEGSVNPLQPHHAHLFGQVLLSFVTEGRNHRLRQGIALDQAYPGHRFLDLSTQLLVPFLAPVQLGL